MKQMREFLQVFFNIKKLAETLKTLIFECKKVGFTFFHQS